MIEWATCSDEIISVRHPKQLRRSKAKDWQRRGGYLFKGRLDRLNPKSEMILAVDANLAPEVAESYINMAHTNPINDAMGVTWCYHHSGSSISRQGGAEVKVTQINPAPHGEGHRWMIVFPLNERWIYVDLASSPGWISWEEFEAIGSEIIKSISSH